VLWRALPGSGCGCGCRSFGQLAAGACCGSARPATWRTTHGATWTTWAATASPSIPRWVVCAVISYTKLHPCPNVRLLTHCRVLTCCPPTCAAALPSCVLPQNKDSPPAGDLDKHYKAGVLFITYSLLTVKGRVSCYHGIPADGERAVKGR